MTLALVLVVCSLFVSPIDAWAAVRALAVLQAAPAASDSPQNPTPTEPKTEPAPDSQPPVEKKPAAVHPKAKARTAAKTAPKKHRARKKVVVPPVDGPKKVIVNNGGASDPKVQLSPGVSPENASRQQQSTNLLLSTTESNLNALSGRQLNASQQDTATQVREYMKQARTAAAAGDLQRAHNLAFKAKLLSDELAKH